MTHALKYIASIACLAATVAFAQVNPAVAKDAPGASTAKKADVSKRHKHRTAHATVVAPARSVWTGSDPTRGGGVDTIRQMQREGRCVMDEGYGRYSGCSND